MEGLGCALLHLAAALMATVAQAGDVRSFNIPPGDLARALESLAKETGLELIFQPKELRGIVTQGVQGTLSPEEAVARLIQGTNLTIRTEEGRRDAHLRGAPCHYWRLEIRRHARARTLAENRLPAARSGNRHARHHAWRCAGRAQAAPEPATHRLEEVVVTVTETIRVAAGCASISAGRHRRGARRSQPQLAGRSRADRSRRARFDGRPGEQHLRAWHRVERELGLRAIRRDLRRRHLSGPLAC